MSVELMQMDCMEYMAGCEDDAFDLAIVDPPYGIGESGKTNASRCKMAVAKDYKPFAGEDKEPPPLEYFSELQRVSKHGDIHQALCRHLATVLPGFVPPPWPSRDAT